MCCPTTCASPWTSSAHPNSYAPSKSGSQGSVLSGGNEQTCRPKLLFQHPSSVRWFQSHSDSTCLPLQTDVHASNPPSTSPMLSPEPPDGPKHLDGTLTSWAPLKSSNCAIAVFYIPDDGKRARQPSERHHFPPIVSTPGITLRVFRPAHTILVLTQPSKPPPDRFYDMTGTT